MNCFAVCLGFLFFLNPCVGTVDIMPDFVGALLILYGTKKISFVSDRVEGVLPKLWGMVAVSIVKTVLMLFSGSFGGSTQVLLTFAFSVVEGILLLNVTGALSDGLESLKIRYGTNFTAGDSLSESDPSAHGGRPEKKKRRRKAEEKFNISKFKLPICAYTVFRLVMCFLPEATELRISKDNGAETGVEALSEFKGLLYTLIIPIVCIFTVFAVIRVIKTFKLYGADKQMLKGFDDAFEQDEKSYPMRHKRRRLKTAYVMLMISTVASVYFYADNKDLIPKVLAAAAFAVLIGFFGKDLKEKLTGFVSCGALAVSSGVYYHFSKVYFLEFTEENAMWLDGAAELYRPLCIASVIEAALHLWVILFATVLIKRAVLQIYSSVDDPETSEKKIKKFKLQMLFFRTVALLFCVAAAIYAPLRPSFSLIINVVLGFDLLLVLSAYFIDMKL